MKKELSSIDINYGFNGEPTTITLSEVGTENPCEALALSEFNTEDIKSQILNGFQPIRSSHSKNGGFKSFTTEYIDAQAQRLDSIAVLVRGVSASQYGSPELLDQRIFFASETPLFRRVYPQFESSKTGVERIGASVIVIGKVYSVLSASDNAEGKNYDAVYHNGELVNKIPDEAWPSEVQERFRYADVSSSMRYGYTVRELMEALEYLGYSIEGRPRQESGLILIENSGSLKNCISSIASMYGLYWICEKNKIKFFSRAAIESIDIPDLTEGCDNISASYSEDFYGKSKVGIISGTPSGRDNTGGGNSFESERTRRLSFALIDSVGDFEFQRTSNIVAKFFTFFKFDGDKELFDWLFWHLYILERTTPTEVSLRDSKFIKALVGDKYENFESLQYKSVDDWKDDKDALKILNPGPPEFFRLPATNVASPSNTRIYPVLKALVELYNSVYISRPVDEKFAENYSVTPTESLTVSSPYSGTTKVMDVGELSEFYVLMQELFDEKKIEQYTLYQLALKIWQRGGVDEPNFILPANQSFFYIAANDFVRQLENEDFGGKIRQQKNLVDELRDPVLPSYINQLGHRSYLPTSGKLRSSIKYADDSSIEFFDTINSIEDKEGLRLKCSRIEEDPSSLEEGSSEQDQAIYALLSAGENKFIGVKSFSGGPLSSIDISTFTTTADSKISEGDLGDLIGVDFPTKSSSETVLGFLPPPNVLDNPSLSSYSINISNGKIETTITHSTRYLLSIDQTVVTAGRTSSSSRNNMKLFKASQKNFLGTH